MRRVWTFKRYDVGGVEDGKSRVMRIECECSTVDQGAWRCEQESRAGCTKGAGLGPHSWCSASARKRLKRSQIEARLWRGWYGTGSGIGSGTGTPLGEPSTMPQWRCHSAANDGRASKSAWTLPASQRIKATRLCRDSVAGWPISLGVLSTVQIPGAEHGGAGRGGMSEWQLQLWYCAIRQCLQLLSG